MAKRIVRTQALGLKTTDVLVGSTGRIGVPLPMPNIRNGIAAIAGHLQPTQAAAAEAAARLRRLPFVRHTFIQEVMFFVRFDHL